MIRVIYNAYDLALLCEGHAGSAPHGEDLVCAAVSAYIYGLAEAVEAMGEPCTVELDEGKALIKCEPVLLHAKAGNVFWAYSRGLKLLSEQYPQYVSYVEIGVG